MNKTAKYGINGALWCGLGNGLLNVIKQLNQMDENPDQKFDWEKLLIAMGKGALVGGSAGLAIGAIADHQKSLEMPHNASVFLASLVAEVGFSKTDSDFKKIEDKAEWLTGKLQKKFNNQFSHDILRHGSTERGTALKGHSDIDLFLSFAPGSFKSTEDMYQKTYDFLEGLLGTNDIVNVRKQTKSAGVIFQIGDEEYKVDVVPSKKTNKNKRDGRAYLYVNDSLFGRGSYVKTDINAIQSVKLSSSQQTLVIILKQWKQKNNVPISSHLLQTLVINAYQSEKGRIPKKRIDKVLWMLEYIETNIDKKVVSIENTNNVLTDLDESTKYSIKEACRSARETYAYHPNDFLELLREETN